MRTRHRAMHDSKFSSSPLQPKRKNNRQPQGLSVIFWSKWRDSNSRPPVPETGALPTALHLDLICFIAFVCVFSLSLFVRAPYRAELLKHSRGAHSLSVVSSLLVSALRSPCFICHRQRKARSLPTALHLDFGCFIAFVCAFYFVSTCPRALSG